MLHVVVVGGGPAGLTAAEALARAGIKTTLLERHPERLTPCSGLVTQAMWQEFAIPEHLLSHRVHELALFSPSGRVAFVNLGAAEKACGVIARDVLQTLLRRRAEEAGVSFIHGRFVRFRHGDGDYPLLEIQVAGATKTEELACDVVVAADGVHSRVAHAAGLAPLPLGVVYQERLVVGAGKAGLNPATMQLHLGRKVSADAFGWALPQGDHLQVGVATSTRYGKRVWDMLAELKRRMGGHLDGARPEGRESYCYPLAWRETLVHDRVLLVGDAAGLTSPATRDSLYYACKSGLMAAQTILRHQHVPLPERLAEYTRAWWSEYGPVFAGARRLETTFFPNDRRREALIDLAWDREIQRAAVDAFLDKRRVQPPLKVAVRLRAKLMSHMVKSAVRQRKRPEADPRERLPAAENYLDLALKTPTGPLRLPNELEGVVEAAEKSHAPKG